MRLVGVVFLATGAFGFFVSPPTEKANVVAKELAAAAASVLLVAASPLPSGASPTAAQISLDKLPPSAIDIQIKDLPVIGNLISGTYTKVADGTVKEPGVVIKSPKDKVKAIKEITTDQHLEFDVSGFLSTHLDVDVILDTPGVATIKVASPLIPKLPFKNKPSPYSGKSSPWKSVTDLGSGDSYFFNEDTGVTQYDPPTDL